MQTSSSYTDLTLSRTVRTQLCGFASHSFPPTSTAAKLSPGFTFTPSRPLILELLPFSQFTLPLSPPGPSVTFRLPLDWLITLPAPPYHIRNLIVPLLSSRLPWRRRQNVATKSWHLLINYTESWTRWPQYAFLFSLSLRIRKCNNCTGPKLFFQQLLYTFLLLAPRIYNFKPRLYTCVHPFSIY